MIYVYVIQFLISGSRKILIDTKSYDVRRWGRFGFRDPFWRFLGVDRVFGRELYEW